MLSIDTIPRAYKQIGGSSILPFKVKSQAEKDVEQLRPVGHEMADDVVVGGENIPRFEEKLGQLVAAKATLETGSSKAQTWSENSENFHDPKQVPGYESGYLVDDVNKAYQLVRTADARLTRSETLSYDRVCCAAIVGISAVGMAFAAATGIAVYANSKGA